MGGPGVKKIKFSNLLDFFGVPTPTKSTLTISETQLSGPKKGSCPPKLPPNAHFFVLAHVFAIFSMFYACEIVLHD